jgi:hypothetical protein
MKAMTYIPFERYADDAICHCKNAEEAQALWRALADRLAACKLALHPEKTKIVYCKDANRQGDYPNQSFDFLGFMFRARKSFGNGHRPFVGYLPAISSKAQTTISRTIRRWALHHHSDKSLQDLTYRRLAYSRFTPDGSCITSNCGRSDVGIAGPLRSAILRRSASISGAAMGELRARGSTVRKALSIAATFSRCTRFWNSSV